MFASLGYRYYNVPAPNREEYKSDFELCQRFVNEYGVNIGVSWGRLGAGEQGKQRRQWGTNHCTGMNRRMKTSISCFSDTWRQKDCNGFVADSLYARLTEADGGFRTPFRRWEDQRFRKVMSDEKRISKEIEECIKDGSCPQIANRKEVTVVVARHKEEINWLRNLDSSRFHIVVYTKPGGREDQIDSSWEHVKLDENAGDEATCNQINKHTSGTLSACRDEVKNSDFTKCYLLLSF